jgi:1-acyl-sn-glycerol-3-phosphate acyltransferase
VARVLYWFLKRLVLGPLVRVIYRPHVEGLENIPAEGAAILASNHLSFCDSVFLPVAVPRRVTFLAKAEYFTTGGVKGWLTRTFMASIGQVPIDRDDADAARAAMNTGVRLLRKGAVLGIYPEGTRSPDGRLYRGKTGVARMALEAGVVVIPCAMIDTDKVQPTGVKIPRLRPRAGIRIGAPLDFSRYEGLSGDRFVERSMTDEIMYELMQLSGQEYVDVYAAKVKAATGANLGFGARVRTPDEVDKSRDDARARALDADRIPTQQAS